MFFDDMNPWIIFILLIIFTNDFPLLSVTTTPPFKNNWPYSTVCVETAHTSSLPFASFLSEFGNCHFRHVFHQTSPQRVWYLSEACVLCCVCVAFPSVSVWMRQAKTKPPKSHLVWRQHIWKRTNSAANTANRMFHSK